MTWLATFLAPIWRPLAAGAVALLGLASVYLKGRADSARKAELKDLRNANDIRKAGAEARDRAHADAAAGQLRDDDGFRRD